MTWETVALADSPLFLWVPQNFAVRSRTDESGHSRTFDQRSWADVPYDTWMDVGTAFTLAIWFSGLTATGFNQMVCREGSTNRVFQARSNGGSMEFVKIAGGTVTASKAASVNDGNDHLAWLTYDGATVSLDVDHSGSPDNKSGTGNLNGLRNLTIGCRYGSNTVSVLEPFPGLIKGVGYFGSVLSGTRHAAHWAAGPPATGLPDGTWDGSSVIGVVG